MEYIHAWLSHPWTDLYLQLIGSDFEGGFIARGTYTLPMVPFVRLDFSDDKQKLLYDQVVATEKRISELNEELLIKKDKATKSKLKRTVITKVINVPLETDGIVFLLFGFQMYSFYAEIIGILNLS